MWHFKTTQKKFLIDPYCNCIWCENLESHDMIFDQMTQHRLINLAKSDSETKSMTEGNVDDGEGEKHRARAIKVFLTCLRSRSVD